MFQHALQLAPRKVVIKPINLKNPDIISFLQAKIILFILFLKIAALRKDIVTKIKDRII